MDSHLPDHQLPDPPSMPQVDGQPLHHQFQLNQVSLRSRVGIHHLLEDLNCTINRGDRIVVTGPSGAGKTFFLRLLNRLNEPTSGTIWFQGQPMQQMPVIQLRQRITLVSQETRLLGMRVQHALEYPLQLRGLSSKVIQQRIATWMDALHIPSAWLDRSEQQLSVGQRQLIAIARGLVSQPDVLLLDEPTSALDVGRATQLLETLRQLSDHTSVTIIMVNHQLELAQQFANRLLYLERGRLMSDQLAADIDWQQIKAAVVNAEVQQAEEWDE